MNSIFLFSGQGSQYQGMLQDIYAAYPTAQKVIDDISDISGEPIKELLWDTDKSVLARSDKGQIAIIAVETAILAVLQEKGIQPAAVAGFSLGEFAALYAAGVLDFTTMIRIVHKRGNIMQKACDRIAAAGGTQGTCGMAAVTKLSPEVIRQILQPYADFEHGTVFAANMNSPQQTVISGTADGLALAEKLCKEAGAKRFIRLAVAGPFHSPLMREAAKEFEAAIATETFADPSIPLFSNVSGKQIQSGAEAKANAVLHLTHPVLWTDEEEAFAHRMRGKEAWQLIEIGPGNTLCNLWRDSGYAQCDDGEPKTIVCLPTGTAEQLQKVLNERT